MYVCMSGSQPFRLRDAAQRRLELAPELTGLSLGVRTNRRRSLAGHSLGVRANQQTTLPQQFDFFQPSKPLTGLALPHFFFPHKQSIIGFSTGCHGLGPG